MAPGVQSGENGFRERMIRGSAGAERPPGGRRVARTGGSRPEVSDRKLNVRSGRDCPSPGPPRESVREDLPHLLQTQEPVGADASPDHAGRSPTSRAVPQPEELSRVVDGGLITREPARVGCGASSQLWKRQGPRMARSQAGPPAVSPNRFWLQGSGFERSTHTRLGQVPTGSAPRCSSSSSDGEEGTCSRSEGARRTLTPEDPFVRSRRLRSPLR